MDTTNKHDWGLVIAGVLLVICSMFFLFAPGLALVTITVIAGAAFLVSGIFDIVNYFRFRRAMDLSGWALAYGALDIVLGILFLVNPLVSAGALAWFIGAFFIVFGVFEVVGAFKVRNMGASMRAAGSLVASASACSSSKVCCSSAIFATVSCNREEGPETIGAFACFLRNSTTSRETLRARLGVSANAPR